MIPSKLKASLPLALFVWEPRFIPGKNHHRLKLGPKKEKCARTTSILLLLSAIFYLDISVNLDNIIMLEKEILEKIYKHYTFSVLNI